MKQIDFTILEQYAVLSENPYSLKQLALVEFGYSGPKFDIRAWGKNSDNSIRPYKGISLSAEELEELAKGLDKLKAAGIID